MNKKTVFVFCIFFILLKSYSRARAVGGEVASLCWWRRVSLMRSSLRKGLKKMEPVAVDGTYDGTKSLYHHHFVLFFSS